jgi:hypothetical protein
LHDLTLKLLIGRTLKGGLLDPEGSARILCSSPAPDANMKFTTLSRTGAMVLPTAMSVFDVYIFAPMEIKDDVRLTSKNSSDGEVVEMSNALYPSGNQPDFCFDQNTLQYNMTLTDVSNTMFLWFVDWGVLSHDSDGIPELGTFKIVCHNITKPA